MCTTSLVVRHASDYTWPKFELNVLFFSLLQNYVVLYINLKPKKKKKPYSLHFTSAASRPHPHSFLFFSTFHFQPFSPFLFFSSLCLTCLILCDIGRRFHRHFSSITTPRWDCHIGFWWIPTSLISLSRIK